MKTEPVFAHCDAGCGKGFELSKYKTRTVKGGNEKIYFNCPHCRQEYLVYYASKETKKLQAQMRKLHREAYHPHTSISRYELERQEQILKNKIKQSMNEARKVSEV